MSDKVFPPAWIYDAQRNPRQIGDYIQGDDGRWYIWDGKQPVLLSPLTTSDHLANGSFPGTIAAHSAEYTRAARVLWAEVAKALRLEQIVTWLSARLRRQKP